MEYVHGMGEGWQGSEFNNYLLKISTVSVSGTKILMLMTHDSYHHLPFNDKQVNVTYL